MKPDLRQLYQSLLPARDPYLRDAQDIADLTIPSIDPMPADSTGHSLPLMTTKGQVYSGSRSSPTTRRRPKTDAGARAVKGFASTLVSTNAPPNVRYFRLSTDPTLSLNEKDQKTIDALFSVEEKRIDQFLSKHNFHAFSNSAMKRLLVEGNIGVKVDAVKGFLLYPLHAVVCERHFGTLLRFILCEHLQIKDKDGKPKTIAQFILVDKQAGQVWVQREDQDKPTLTDELASQYFVSTSDLPATDHYARAFYSDHLGLLHAIDKGAEALLEAQACASWNFMTYSGKLPVARLAQVRPREIVNIGNDSHDDLRPFSFQVKIADWSFVAQKLEADINSLLNLSAVGLSTRAASIQTAEEVRAIRNELASLVGSTAQTISQTYYHAVVNAIVDLLGIRSNLQRTLALEQGVSLSPEEMELLVQPIVITGTPALAREQDAERLLYGVRNLIQTFGPEAAQYFSVPEISKEYLDGLRINTDGIVVEPMPVDAAALPIAPGGAA